VFGPVRLDPVAPEPRLGSPLRTTLNLSVREQRFHAPFYGGSRSSRKSLDSLPKRCCRPSSLPHDPTIPSPLHNRHCNVSSSLLRLPDYDCLAASRLARYSRSPSSTGLNASYLDSASGISFDLVLANLAATFTAPLATK